MDIILALFAAHSYRYKIQTHFYFFKANLYILIESSQHVSKSCNNEDREGLEFDISQLEKNKTNSYVHSNELRLLNKLHTH